jgi:hypothetical protein
MFVMGVKVPLGVGWCLGKNGGSFICLGFGISDEVSGVDGYFLA